MMETRICSKCGIEKPLNKDHFPLVWHRKTITTHRKQGEQTYKGACHVCSRIINRKSHIKNKHKYLITQKKYRMTLSPISPEKRQQSRRKEALKKGKVYRTKQQMEQDRLNMKIERRNQLDIRNSVAQCRHCKEVKPIKEMNTRITCLVCFDHVKEEAALRILRRQREATSNLKDIYIKKKLKRLNITITHITIELERQAISMKRMLRNFKKWRKENEHPDC